MKFASRDPENKGWICEVKVDDVSEMPEIFSKLKKIFCQEINFYNLPIETLMCQEKYDEYLKQCIKEAQNLVPV